MTVGFKTTYNGRTIEIDDLLMKREYFSDGALWTWGRNTGGQLGTTFTVKAVAEDTQPVDMSLAVTL